MYKYYLSETYGQECRLVYGRNLKQFGLVTMDGVDELLTILSIQPEDIVLDYGCGVGLLDAYMSTKTGASFVCWDKDPEVITRAKEISNNCNLSFDVVDLRINDKVNERFDKILVMDSLYDISPKETYSLTLTSILDSLWRLLKNKGTIAVYWTEAPFYELKVRGPECTQIGLWAASRGLEYTVIDKTEDEYTFWKNVRESCGILRDSYYEEGFGNIYEQHNKEANFFINRAELGLLYRNLYIICKL